MSALSAFRLLVLLLISSASGHGADLRVLHFSSFEPDFALKRIKATLTQTWEVQAGDTFSLFLKAPLRITRMTLPPEGLLVEERGEQRLFTALSSGRFSLTLQYEGEPQAAVNPPWDGGTIWRSDPQGKPWLTVACQDVGAHVWWPAPAAYSQEADTTQFTAIYPANLFFKGNGRMLNDRVEADRRTTTWICTYPINLYNITVNIGDYVKQQDWLKRKDGSRLKIEYYPLRVNARAAAKQFKQTIPMLKCFEQYFGEYPCSRDGFSVVETPYPGMEHQGAIAYGNGYVDGYGGEDYSGVGLWFDFILIHETAHEWWGNSVTAANAYDFWMQEAFCTYAEMVYVRCRFGVVAANKYIAAKRRFIQNKAPMYGLTHDIDCYAKGALMLHTLSRFYTDQETWLKELGAFAQSMKHKSLSTTQLVQWFRDRNPAIPAAFFDQYLKKASPPQLKWTVTADGPNQAVDYVVSNALEGFELPLKINTTEGPKFIKAGAQAKRLILPAGSNPKPDPDYSYWISLPE